jgi:hypothetical protein
VIARTPATSVVTKASIPCDADSPCRSRRRSTRPSVSTWAARIERIRRLCENLHSALSGATEQCELIAKMKAEADALRASLSIHKNRFEST